MDDLTFDKLVRGNHAVGEVVKAVADILAVERGIADALPDTARAPLERIRTAAQILRESAALLLVTAHTLDGMQTLVEPIQIRSRRDRPAARGCAW